MRRPSFPQLFSLQGRVALVTGAAGQLGRQLSEALYEAGAHVVLSDLDVRACEAIARGFRKRGRRAVAVRLDVTDRRSIEEALREARRRLPPVDILVNNAGIAVFTPIAERTDAEWSKVMDVNLRGAFLCSQAVIAEMRRRRRGVIVNIASVYGIVSADPRIYGRSGRNSSEVYAASKAGVIQMTKYLAAHLASRNVRVNCISPGGVFNRQHPEFVKRYADKTPLGRMAREEDVKGAVVYLASEASAYVTGHNLVVDGGFSIW